jgi:hypothetical protein
VVRDHVDNEEVRNLGQREKRGVEEGHEEETRRAQRQREGAYSTDDFAHRISR